MKPRLGLLFTPDGEFAEKIREALSGTGVIALIARDVCDAMQIVCRRGSELDFAVLDFNDGCRGMTLLSALHTCYEQLPILVTTSEDTEYATAVAYANGARACLNKPLHAGKLTGAIADLNATRQQLVAA